MQEINILKLQIVKLLNQGDNKGAAQLGRRLCNEQPNDFESHLLLSVALLNAEKYDKSRRALIRGLQIFPKDWKLHEILGHVYGHLNRIPEAEKEYNEAIIHYNGKNKEEEAFLHYQLGETMWAQNKRDAAIEQWKQALKVNPDCLEAKESLEENINEYGEPKAPNPVFDDLYHFHGIHIKRYFDLTGRDEFSSQEEAKNILDIIKNGWNEYISPRSRDIDKMSAAQRSEFFKSITLNFRDVVIKWRNKN